MDEIKDTEIKNLIDKYTFRKTMNEKFKNCYDLSQNKIEKNWISVDYSYLFIYVFIYFIKIGNRNI
jgi:hypothetical protein